MIKKRQDAASASPMSTLSYSNENQRLLSVINGRYPSRRNPEPPKYFAYKYAFERVVAALLLIPALPIIAFCAALIRLTSRGPAIYRQERVGLDGKVFSMLKIRTMVVDAEAESGPIWSNEFDPRITRAGRLLRFLHLDELPQLINVLQGEMAIIGPRPERPDFVDILMDYVDGYDDRLAVKPGITGLAQIYLPPDETVDCVRRKVVYDREYIRTATPVVDIQIWLCTIVRMLGLRKGRGPHWTGLDRRYSKLASKCDQVNRQRNGTPTPAERNGNGATQYGNGRVNGRSHRLRVFTTVANNGSVSNAHRNGPTNGHSNGHANGHTNGSANGHTNGHTKRPE